MNTTKLIFDWTTFYMAFADKLLTYKNSRTELLAILRAAHEQIGLRCQFANFNDIDPFTVFGAFNKGITKANRLALISALAELMDIKVAQPTDFDGVPVLMNMMAIVTWNEEDIGDVWRLFEVAINYADSLSENNRVLFVKLYNAASKHKGISWNITVGLYWIRPYTYLNLDSVNRSFLLNNEKFESIKTISKLNRVPDAETYLKIIDICRESFNEDEITYRNFPELSHTAWLKPASNMHGQGKKLAEANCIQWFEPLIQALKDLGGDASPDATRSQIVANLNLSNDIANETYDDTGVKKFDREVAFARQYLIYEKIIDGSTYGNWSLTEKGKNTTMTDELAEEIFYKWVNILAEHNKDVKRETSERYFWLYALGKNANEWEDFYSQGIIAAEWDALDNLTQYQDKKVLREKIKELYGAERIRNISTFLWNFHHTINVGDIIFARISLGSSMNEIIGRGIVESDYIFIPERDKYKHVRKINWTHKGSWDYPAKSVTNDLVNVTVHTEYVQKLEELIVGDADALFADDEVKYDDYRQDDFLGEVFMSAEQYETLTSILYKKRNLILQGAPGVGKTYAAKRLAYSMIGEKDTRRVMVVQFHQSYSYEDFIMGFRPAKDGFELVEGPFYTFCKKAQDDLERDYFFIIDEINRGNLSKIFGELLMLIESDKRGEKLRLLYSNELFSVPKNVYIIGLMNTADRSLAMMDYALRRRFAFYEMIPAFDSSGFVTTIENSGHDKFAALIERVKELNEAIAKDESLGDGFRIGHSYFCTDDEVTDYWLASVVNFEILPLLNEYWFDEKSKIDSWAKKLRGILND